MLLYAFRPQLYYVADFEKMALVSQNEAWEQQFPESLLSNFSKVQLIRILHTTTQEIVEGVHTSIKNQRKWLNSRDLLEE